jgi:hypothetical protein
MGVVNCEYLVSIRDVKSISSGVRHLSAGWIN